MNGKNTTIGILIVLVVLFAGLWLEARNDLQVVLAGLENQTRDYQAEIREKCGEDATAAEIAQNEDCKKTLNDFAEVLSEYNDRLQNAESSSDKMAQ